ncbi:MAG: calcium-binding protein [Gammaproteobacteria bacterium]|nr:calcium-binding protein [Gammaproteobacteria bacterium]
MNPQTKLPEPKRPAFNHAREHRIEQEIVADAYTSEERAISWHCYLDDKLRFPFKAKCIAAREISPLKKGEEIEVLGMASEDDCMHEMFVSIRFAGRKLGVPLAQIEPIGADAATREAVADWRYWQRMGREF